MTFLRSVGYGGVQGLFFLLEADCRGNRALMENNVRPADEEGRSTVTGVRRAASQIAGALSLVSRERGAKALVDIGLAPRRGTPAMLPRERGKGREKKEERRGEGKQSAHRYTRHVRIHALTRRVWSGRRVLSSVASSASQ